MLVLVYTISVLLMILMPVLLAAWLRRIFPVPWLLFGIGSLVFVLSQTIHLPLNKWLADLGFLPGRAVEDLPIWRIALTLGLSSGLCEELTRAAGYTILQRAKPGWLRLQDGIMLGLGHGGIESMVFGGVVTAATLSSLLPLRSVDLSSMGLQPEQLNSLKLQLTLLKNPLYAGLPLVERVIVLIAQAIFSLIVWKAFVAGASPLRWVYLPLAILYHAALDFLAVWGAWKFQQQPFLLEWILLGALLPGLGWVVWIFRRAVECHMAIPYLDVTASGLDESIGSELEVFWAAVIKELCQVWRTKRLVVVAAVFLIFGMLSPLSAKFTPQILGAIEGAEMFADLIPEPTAGDAMAQYIKNITQFGFILAVLLGMGAVVGEKETRVAPMILSKPMPRWAFISSKFLAQFLMYAGGFLLSGLGAYYYTLVLFGTLDLGGFALANGLLLLWLLTFVALSLLSSTLGRSTAAAGGIGLGLSLALILAGNLPDIGGLLPSGIVDWATSIALTAAGSQVSMPGFASLTGEIIPNAGAMASAVVTIAMALILAVGFFEQQEL